MFNINLFDLMNAKDNALHDNLESDDNEEFNISITISSKKKEKFDTVQKESNKAKEAIPKEEKKDINTKDNGNTSKIPYFNGNVNTCYDKYLVGEELYNKTFVQRSQKNSSKQEKIENIEDKKEEVQNSLSSHSNIDSDLADMIEQIHLCGNDDEISDNVKRCANNGDDVYNYFGK